MAAQRKVLFLQLPQLDNDVAGPNENVPLAAAYLQHAAESAGEHRHHQFLRLPPSLDHAGTRQLLDHILTVQPDVLACTLYLWNIEWTLRLLRAAQARLPHLRSVVGGPEVAFKHPFLFRAHVADAIAVGEGEPVFPGILRAFRTGGLPDFLSVATRNPRGYQWGHRQPAAVELARALPPPDHPACRPVNGIACIETSRGCPMRCTYCRYPHLRRTLSFLPPDAVAARVSALMRCGAREIRFIDPTLNAHPAFAGILSRLGRLNRRKSVRFFAELNADRIGEREAALLAKAHFTEVEVGLQSRDPVVLRAIRRPTHLARLEAGVRAMARRGIRVTLDVMYGLPCQGLDDLRATLPWALGLRRVNVQCLRTLLLPGTELRARRRRWRLAAQPRPPYAVTASASLSGADLRAIEDLVAEHPRLRSDIPTRRFAGRSLPDLFPVRIHTSLHDLARTAARPCPGDRCAFLIHGADLFAHRPSIARAIRKLIRSEPDGLFQFVLVPEHEEPLDLLDHLIAVLRTGPPHLLDRYAALTRNGKLAARRVMVLQRPSHGLEPDWLDAADSLLAEHFA